MNKQQIPNLLTGARMLAVPMALLVMLYAPAATQLLFWIFLVASLTDYLDGYLARAWKVESALGALFDPVADKLLVALMLLYLLKTDHSATLLLPVAVIILREIYVSGLREFMAGRKLKLPVSPGGKWKTATQMVAIGGILFAMAYGQPGCFFAGRALLWVAAFLALLSAYDYTRKALPQLR